MIQWRWLLVDAFQSPLWEILVGTGLVVLSAGALLWALGCVRLALLGHTSAATPLAAGGLGLAASAVAVPITWYALVWPQPVTLFGWHFTVPTLGALSQCAGGWVPLGLGLGLMGAGLLAIRRPARTDDNSLALIRGREPAEPRA